MNDSTTPSELRVFVSSTFRDLQDEREYLVKKIFPRIRALCRERGVVFTEIDLRWGLTEEEAAHGRVVRACLEEIDRCRPHFIGIIGSRYGWVPEYHEIAMDPELHSRYPWVEDAALNGESILEIEFAQAVLQASCPHAFFYRRLDEEIESEDADRLDHLVSRIEGTGHLREFRNPEDLGDRVLADLTEVINEVWTPEEIGSPLKVEERRHNSFARSRRRAYIPIPAYRQRFEAWFREGEAPLVVSGGSGMGKSALVAWLIETYRSRQPEAFILEHYVGAAGASGDHHGLIRRIVAEIHGRYGVEEELPDSGEELEAAFPAWLGRVGAVHGFEGEQLLLVVDALDQLGSRSAGLHWLPERMPSGVRLIVSTRPGPILETLRGRAWEELPIEPLEIRAREAIVVRYLGEFHKSLPTPLIRKIGEDPKSSSPLFLRTLAEEMRLHGPHEELDERLDRYLGAPDIDTLFQFVLERMEKDYGVDIVRPVLSALSVSRSGLAESDIIGVSGVGRADLSILLFALDYHLLRSNGRLNFFHGYLKRAVEVRYLSDEERHASMNRALISWFSEGVDLTAESEDIGTDRGGMLELLHGLYQGGERDRLIEVLGSAATMLVLFEGEGEYEVLSYWNRLDRRGEILGVYRRTLEMAAVLPAERRCDLLIRVARLLRSLSFWPEAEKCAAEAALLAEEMEAPKRGAEALETLGGLHLLRGAYGEARRVYEKRRRLAEAVGDDLAMALADGEIGTVELEEGRPSEARERFETMLQICGKRKHRAGMARALAKIGEIDAGAGSYDQGLARFREALDIFQSLGDRRQMAVTTGQIGLIDWNQKAYDQAMVRYGEEEKIYHHLGDRHGASMALCKIGLVHLDRHDLNAAEECFREYLDVTTDLGYTRGIGFAQGDIGIVHFRRKEYDQAMQRFNEALKTHRDLGFPFGVAIWLKWKGETVLNRVEEGEEGPEAVEEAIVWTKESIDIAERIGNHETAEEGREVLRRMVQM